MNGAMNASVVRRGNMHYAVIEVPSNSNPNKMYRVDVTNKRCSCRGWTMHFPRRPCIHLKSLGIYS